MSVLSVITTLASGGVTGLLGGFLSKGMEVWKQKEDRKSQADRLLHEQTMRKIDGDIMLQEWKQRADVARIEGEAEVDVSDSQAFAASFKMEPKKYSSGVKAGPITGAMLISLDFIRGMVRPGLTLYLCGITTLIWFEISAVQALADVTPDQAFDLQELMVTSILYLTTTCVLWWFGTRAPRDKKDI
jgi:hypothetical protein|tara:strand:+ start:5947 stop:6507 length:561 start_codon:yes stop_codon:yes gene_type:complete